MSYGELYIAECTMHRRLRERRHEIEVLHLTRQSGVQGRGWLSRQIGLLLCRLGYLLVTFGERLERYSAPQPLSLEESGRSG